MLKKRKKFIALLVSSVLVLSANTVIFAGDTTDENVPDVPFIVSKDMKTGEVKAELMNGATQEIPVPDSEVSLSGNGNAGDMDISPHIIIGTDGRTQVTNTTTRPYSAICYIEVRYPDGSLGGGTGFLWKGDTVITAGHIVYSSENGGWATDVVVAPARSAQDLPYSFYEATYLYAGGSWFEDRDFNGDFGVIKLDGNVNVNAGTFVLSTNQSTNQAVTVTGYPEDKDGGTTMWKSTGKITALSTYMLQFDCDTIQGMSGSPIYNSNSQVVGILSADNALGNYGVRIISDFVNWIATT